MHDIIIKNGTLFDGTGSERFSADIAINDNHISEIGDLDGEKSRETINAKGKYILPGFIDISNRSDVYWRLFTDVYLESLLRQGITTMIGGNSGSSLAPIYNEQMLRSTQKWANVRDVNVSWQSVGDFLTSVEDTHAALHFGTFVGHGTLRRGIVGDEERALSKEEMKKLVEYITRALSDGALGVSLGLVYVHGRSATYEELVQVASLVKKENKLLAVHLRDEDANLIDALDEVFQVVRETKVRAHITHLKAIGKSHWPLMKEGLKRIEQMRAEGFDITFDVYPYTMTGSVLYTFVPTWLNEGGKKMLLTRLKNKNIYDRAVSEINNGKIDLSQAIVSICPQMETVRGKTLGELAVAQERTVGEVVLELLLASEGRVVILLDVLSEENIVRAITHPYSLITSNSAGYTITPELSSQALHPRSFGAFPRAFHRYVTTKEELSWELAVHKSTGKVARALGITDRGFLQEGLLADVAIINPQEFRDYAKVGEAPEYAGGVDTLIVAGHVAIKDGMLTGIRAGGIVRN